MHEHALLQIVQVTTLNTIVDKHTFNTVRAHFLPPKMKYTHTHKKK